MEGGKEGFPPRDQIPELLRLALVSPEKLPVAFEVSEPILDGITLLRTATAEKRVEVGGVLAEHTNGKHYIKPLSNGTDKTVVIHHEIVTEDNIAACMREQQFRDEHNLANVVDIYFTDNTMAAKYGHYFERLVQSGAELLIDARPLAFPHTHHHTDALPSPRDFAFTLFRDKQPTALDKPIMVSANWTYFLVPTTQTPNLSHVSDTREAFITSLYRRENQAVRQWNITHPLDKAETSGFGEQRNTARMDWLQKYCRTYKVGFYGLEKGKSVAVKVA